ncbi:hypothetical protein [Oceanirhabdus sp. W0125-5]|uniref:hypothetical protein n=1 Tax=Oceanirhabdus sp. W0125-5 TaxID=2999116 RepID=UPI0022F33EA6|nr:hypothetical protein [Oceanirhabdus sp. W0125-5]WBW95824.1 hypothetical protein OW730_19335 [Oceanirhabdus sp. W0125-5]
MGKTGDYLSISMDKKICRYMDFIKFMNLLHYEELFFARADKFEDALEGKIPDCYFNRYSKEQKLSYEEALKVFNKDKVKTFISCWNVFEEESYGLWKIYGGENGMAILTTLEKFKDALKYSNAAICEVEYIKHEDIDIKEISSPRITTPNGLNRNNFFVYKENYYHYEKEVRAIIATDERAPHKKVKINFNELVEKIIISPFACDWFVDMVKDIVSKKYGFSNIPIYKSNIEINLKE